MKFYPDDHVRHKFIKSPEVFEVSSVTPEGRVILRGNRCFGPVDPCDLVLISREQNGLTLFNEPGVRWWVCRKEDQDHPVLGDVGPLSFDYVAAPWPWSALKFGDRVHVAGREGVYLVLTTTPDPTDGDIKVAHETGSILFVKPDRITLLVEDSK